ncbi:hypothetical protein SWSSV_gp169 [White spot syndrome virus]|uniref:Wsv493 n=4 Tax=White spot syndrome virus TaxID=342409 RepID=Q8VAD2_WSSVS|nr:wsv493 [Shrimp white spot syndrome virus]YP_009220643.1 hypothetical protein SWSSV_gp169 [White spot syndrome virus]AAL33494.1 wsv493 [Shrimp white spot syndrome virus]AAL88887.1 WSSV019 [Shrimp white spot syndrome virus]AAP87279.1 VP35 [Shrimp white spot syndrome virus]AAQ02886.1 nucleocapsid protein [Shrimp white spot syndrome virus]ALN66612.1 hypothetical protein [White spot syndrome virus]
MVSSRTSTTSSSAVAATSTLLPTKRKREPEEVKVKVEVKMEQEELVEDSSSNKRPRIKEEKEEEHKETHHLSLPCKEEEDDGEEEEYEEEEDEEEYEDRVDDDTAEKMENLLVQLDNTTKNIKLKNPLREHDMAVSHYEHEFEVQNTVNFSFGVLSDIGFLINREAVSRWGNTPPPKEFGDMEIGSLTVNQLLHKCDNFVQAVVQKVKEDITPSIEVTIDSLIDDPCW